MVKATLELTNGLVVEFSNLKRFHYNYHEEDLPDDFGDYQCLAGTRRGVGVEVVITDRGDVSTTDPESELTSVEEAYLHPDKQYLIVR